jgi:hypothetical protein
VLAEWLALIERTGRITPELFLRTAREKPLLIEIFERLVPTVSEAIFSVAVRAAIAQPVPPPHRPVPLCHPAWLGPGFCFAWDLFMSIFLFCQAMVPAAPRPERAGVADADAQRFVRAGADEGLRLDKVDFRRLVLIFFGWDDSDMLDSVFFLHSKMRSRKGLAPGSAKDAAGRWIDLDGLVGAITMIAKGSVKERIRVLCKGHDKVGLINGFPQVRSLTTNFKLPAG